MINYKCTWTCKCISRKLRQKWHEWRISLFSQGGFIYFIYTSQKMKRYTPSTSFKNLFVCCLKFFLYCFNLYVDGSKVAAVLTILQKSERSKVKLQDWKPDVKKRRPKWTTHFWNLQNLFTVICKTFNFWNIFLCGRKFQITF